MMKSIFILLALVLVAESSFAAKKKDDTIDSLVRENESLSVALEDTVQVARPESRRTFDFFIGRESAKNFSLYLKGEKTQYNLDGFTALNIQYGYYPYRRKIMFGILGGVGYSYVENHIGDRDTALHLIPIEAMLASRYAFSSRFEVVAGLGGGVMASVQRGDEADNSSQAKGFGVGQVGLSYGPKVQSDLPWEILLMYGRRFGPASDSQNWNGDYVRLGAGVRLD